MPSPGPRIRAKTQQKFSRSMVKTQHDVTDNMRPPRYTINLSLSPSKRYDHIAGDFKGHLESLPALFDEIVGTLNPVIPVFVFRWFAWLLLRHVEDKEETEELRGIQRATGLDLYLLVAFNVLLDLLMGCTSGGVRVKQKTGRCKMLHFRTLDWGMEGLRKLIVRLDYVEHINGPIVASTISYFGFVGVLTGVKKGMSVSLNSRSTHDTGTWLVNVKFCLHQLLVLLGIRPSVSSLLRKCLIPSKGPSQPSSTPSTLDELESRVRGMHSTVASLIMSDGKRTVTMEKDNGSAAVKSAYDFIVALGHDSTDDSLFHTEQSKEHTDKEALDVVGTESIIRLSKERKINIVNLWREARIRERLGKRKYRFNGELFVTQQTLENWMNEYPIANEETHFACIMDPEAGKILWTKHYLKPIESNPQDDRGFNVRGGHKKCCFAIDSDHACPPVEPSI